MGEATHILKIVIQVIDKATAPLDKAKQSIDGVNKKLDGFKRRMDFTFLTFIFTGMVLERTAMNVTRNIISIMDKIEGYVSPATQMVMGLRAEFEYLKFAIFNSLSQSPVFKSTVEGLTKIMDTVVKLAQEPKNVDLAVSIVKATAIIGAGFMISGFVMQIGAAVAAIFKMCGMPFTAVTASTQLGLGLGVVTAFIGIAMTINDIANFDQTVSQEGLAAAIIKVVADMFIGLAGIFFVVASIASAMGIATPLGAIGAVILTMGLAFKFLPPVIDDLSKKFKEISTRAEETNFVPIMKYFITHGTLEGFDFNQFIDKTKPFSDYLNEATKTVDNVQDSCELISTSTLPKLATSTTETVKNVMTPQFTNLNSNLSLCDASMLGLISNVDAFCRTEHTATVTVNYVHNNAPSGYGLTGTSSASDYTGYTSVETNTPSSIKSKYNQPWSYDKAFAKPK